MTILARSMVNVIDGHDKCETPNNLTRYRWASPIPTHAELADLIRLAKRGDRHAGHRLVECLHRMVLKLASRFYGPSQDDLIAAGMEGLWCAIRQFDPKRNNGFYAHAEPLILKMMRTEVAQWRRRGQAGGTRSDWMLYRCPGLRTPEELVPPLNRSEAGPQRTDQVSA